MSELILLRHGQSQWNLENRFTGWVDVPLSAKGEDEARAAGEKLRGRRIDVLYTSVLKRAVDTATLARQVAGIHDAPTGAPLLYEIGPDGRVLDKRYL